MEEMLKMIVDKVTNGDTTVTEKEIALATFYELRTLNDKLENLEERFSTSVKSVAARNDDLRKTVEAQEKKIEELEVFKIEYQAYWKVIPAISLVISFLTGVVVLWQKLKP